MKKVGLFIFLVGVSFGAWAQEGTGPEEMPTQLPADKEISPMQFSLDSSYHNSTSFYGNDNVLGADYQLDHDHLLIVARRLARTYTNQSELADTQFGLGYVSVLGTNVYWENMVLVAPNALFIPTQSYQTRPHYALGNHDFSLGLTYNSAPNLLSGVLNPQWLYQWADQWSLNTGVFIARAANTDVAGQVGVKYNLDDVHHFTLNSAFGRTLEDVGVETNFYSLAFNYLPVIHPGITFGPTYFYYVSTTRTEQAVGLRIELKL